MPRSETPDRGLGVQGLETQKVQTFGVRHRVCSTEGKLAGQAAGAQQLPFPEQCHIFSLEIPRDPTSLRVILSPITAWTLPDHSAMSNAWSHRFPFPQHGPRASSPKVELPSTSPSVWGDGIGTPGSQGTGLPSEHVSPGRVNQFQFLVPFIFFLPPLPLRQAGLKPSGEFG